MEEHLQRIKDNFIAYAKLYRENIGLSFGITEMEREDELSRFLAIADRKMDGAQDRFYRR